VRGNGLWFDDLVEERGSEQMRWISEKPTKNCNALADCLLV
jgi:hypothetical protein